MIKDVNDLMPNLPGMKWGALFNWELTNAEIDQMVKSPIFPEDSKWHTVLRDIHNMGSNKEIIVDGHVIRQSDDRKLT